MTIMTATDLRHVAETTASILEDEYGHTLDYSLKSLNHIDAIIQDMISTEATPDDDLPTTVYGIGAYVGEVLICSLGGHWIERHGSCLVHLPSGVLANPIGKVRERFRFGIEDSIATFGFAMRHSATLRTLSGPERTSE